MLLAIIHSSAAGEMLWRLASIPNCHSRPYIRGAVDFMATRQVPTGTPPNTFRKGNPMENLNFNEASTELPYFLMKVGSNHAGKKGELLTFRDITATSQKYKGRHDLRILRIFISTITICKTDYF